MAVNPKSIQNLQPAKKGEIRNPKGKPCKLPDLDILMAEVLGEEKDGKTAAQAILAALRAKAAKGDIRAAELLLNRGYGLPKQKIEQSGAVAINAVTIFQLPDNGRNSIQGDPTTEGLPNEST